MSPNITSRRRVFSTARLGLAAVCLVAWLTPSVSAQVVVDGRDQGVTIQAHPIQRTYSQVYSQPNRARLITRQGVVSSASTVTPVQTAAYIQPGYVQTEIITGGQPTGAVDLRLDPYAHRRYLNYSYYENMYYARRSHRGYGYGAWYGYEYYPGFYYYWWPSFSNYAFCYRPSYSCGSRYYGGHGGWHHGGYRGSHSYYGGSYIRFNSSCGLSVRLRF